MVEIILASKSKVRKEILDKNEILNKVEPSNVDEDFVKESLLKERATLIKLNQHLKITTKSKHCQKSCKICVLILGGRQIKHKMK